MGFAWALKLSLETLAPAVVTSRVADAEHFEARQIGSATATATAYRVDAIYGGARGVVGPTATSVIAHHITAANQHHQAHANSTKPFGI